MNCTNCGKELPEDSTDTLCDDCKNLEGTQTTAQTAPVQSVSPSQSTAAPQTNTKMAGFGPALAALILGVGSYIFAMVAYMKVIANVFGGITEVLSFLSGNSVSFNYNLSSSLITTGIVCSILAIACGIPAIVLGAKSIATFKRVKNQGGTKPVITLIFGIVALALGIGMTFLSILILIDCGLIAKIASLS